jgi:hypothetical protein
VTIELNPQQMRDLAIRFWENVETSPGCWDWTGKVNQQGYGYLSRAGLNIGKGVLLAPRVSYLLSNGYWPEPLCRHLCHRPICVSPGHLIQGTAQDNWDDRRAMLAGIDLLVSA